MPKFQGKLLLIEDSESFRLIYKERLEYLGLKVYEAENGQKGWDLALKIVPDVIVSGLMLPQVDGFEVL